MITRDKILSTDFQVLLHIYEDNIRKIPATFTRLMQQTELSRMQLGKSIDRLYDKIMIDAKPTVIKQQKLQQYFEEKVLNKEVSVNKIQCMSFYISENFLPFTKGLYNATEDLTEEDVEELVAKKQKQNPKIDDKQKHLEDFDTQENGAVL